MTSSLYAICDECSENVALVTPGTDKAICSACRAYRYTEQSIDEAAQEQLQELTTVLGAWTAIWSAQGLSMESLAQIVDDVSYVGRFSFGAPTLVEALLRKLRMENPLPSPDEVEEVAQRVQFDLQTLPLLTEFYFRNPEAQPSVIRPLPIFKDAAGEIYRPPTGLSSMTFTLPDETQVFLFTDLRGRVTPELTYGPAGYRIAKELRPIFEYYLRGPDHWDALSSQIISK